MRITDDCMSCGMCSEECPADAIYPGERVGNSYAKYEIDTDLCVECGNCVEVCPGDAIVAG